MKILVTGGAGFIGSHVVEWFAKNGDEVIAIDNFLRNEIFGNKMRNQLYNWSYIKQYKNVKLIKSDIRNFNEIKDVAKNVEAIIHTAAQVAVTTSLINPRVDFEINALGTFNILEVARLNDSNVIFCSTNKVYGENVNRIPIEEKETRYEFADPRYKEGIPEDFSVDLTGHSPYGSSKLAADIYVQDYAHTYGLKTAVFRQSCIYGERQFGVEDQGWIAWFVIATLTGTPITIYGNGKQVRDLLHVKDLIKAFDMFLNSKVKHVVLNIGGGPRNALSLIEALNMLKQLTNKVPSISFTAWRPMDQKVYISNIKKAREILNWEPRITLKEGIKNLVKWVRENLALFR
jgi:CDP-paratose 2-epimerase